MKTTLKRMLLILLALAMTSSLFLTACTTDNGGEGDTTVGEGDTTEEDTTASGDTGEVLTEVTNSKGEHVHSYGIWHTVKEPDCVNNGLNERYCYCGKVRAQVVKATGHKWGEWNVASESTCSVKGQEKRVCRICGAEEFRDLELAENHTGFGEWVKVDSGLFAGYQYHKCADCGEISITLQDATNFSEGVACQYQDTEKNLVVNIGTCTSTELVLPKLSTDPKHPNTVVTGIGTASFSAEPIINSTTNPYAETNAKLTSVTLPEGYSVIGNNAFKDCTNLQTVKLPSTLELIYAGAFDGCTSIQTIVLPDLLDKVRSGLFRNCTALETVFLGRTTNVIDMELFAGCTALTTIFYNGTAEMWAEVKIDKDWLGVIRDEEAETTLLYNGYQADLEAIDTDDTIEDKTTAKSEREQKYNTDLDTLKQEIKNSNEAIEKLQKQVTIYCLSEEAPTTEGNFWHFDESGNPAIWEAN